MREKLAHAGRGQDEDPGERREAQRARRQAAGHCLIREWHHGGGGGVDPRVPARSAKGGAFRVWPCRFPSPPTSWLFFASPISVWSAGLPSLLCISSVSCRVPPPDGGLPRAWVPWGVCVAGDVVELVGEFLEVCIHQLLCIRELYPPGRSSAVFASVSLCSSQSIRFCPFDDGGGVLLLGVRVQRSLRGGAVLTSLFSGPVTLI